MDRLWIAGLPGEDMTFCSILTFPRVQLRVVLVVIFCIFEIIIFCFVVDICDLVHDVEAICGLC